MTTPQRSEPFHEPMPFVEHVGKWFIGLAIAFIVLGTLAIMMPFVAGLAITTLVGVLLLVGGVMHAIGAFRGEGIMHKVGQFVIALFYLVAGVYFLGNPLIALVTLTMFLAAVLFVEAIVDIVAYFQRRHVQGAGWLLVNGIITFILSVLIWRHWPAISIWAIGTLVGIDLIVNGISRLMLGSAVRSVLTRRFA
jgi:uncharacterized membrane protein HdeD (DUF308 family)